MFEFKAPIAANSSAIRKICNAEVGHLALSASSHELIRDSLIRTHAISADRSPPILRARGFRCNCDGHLRHRRPRGVGRGLRRVTSFEMVENLFDHRRILDAGYYPQGYTAETTGLDVNLEHPFQALCLSHCTVTFSRSPVLLCTKAPAAPGQRYLTAPGAVGYKTFL